MGRKALLFHRMTTGLGDPVQHKGVPDRKSRTGTRLVSPTISHEKKMEASGPSPYFDNLSILGHIVVLNNGLESNPVKQEAKKGPETHNCHWILILSPFPYLEINQKFVPLACSTSNSPASSFQRMNISSSNQESMVSWFYVT